MKKLNALSIGHPEAAQTARDLTKTLSVYLVSFTCTQSEDDAIRASCNLLAK